MSDTTVTADPRLDSDFAEASQWKLIYRRFRKHKVAVLGLYIVLFLYLLALFAEFFQPFDPNQTSVSDVFHPPQKNSLVRQG